MKAVRAAFGIVVAAWPALPARPAFAQQEPVGPCSPYRAADGDIPSELPGCGRRLRPAPGSLADEMQFRRARPDAGNEESDDEPPPRTPARRRPAR